MDGHLNNIILCEITIVKRSPELAVDGKCYIVYYLVISIAKKQLTTIILQFVWVVLQLFSYIISRQI